MLRFWITLLVWASVGSAAAAVPDELWHAYLVGRNGDVAPKLRALADRGDANAAYYLGSLYADGVVLREDPRTAAAWYQKAAERGHVLA